MIKTKNISCGYLYAYVHFITEIICFYFLSKITNNFLISWLVPLMYDGLAFVPQSLIGYFKDKYPKMNVGIIGTILLFIGLLIFKLFDVSVFIPLIIICLGNCFLHISGANATLKSSNGKLSHSAIFVAGGSFGVISGKLLAKTIISEWILLALILTMIPFILLADTYIENKHVCNKFNYSNSEIGSRLVIFLTIFVVIVRGYIGYGIPTSWNTTTIQTIALFVTMGIGKALGGILSDKFGIRKVAIFSTLVSIPFLCAGDNQMYISLIGIMLFSMTMSITLAILVSELQNKPNFAFGLTTVGLFLGAAPIFFITFTSKIVNIIVLIVLSLICTLILSKVLRKES